MAEENSQLNNLQEENGALELQSLVERVGDLPLLSPKEGGDSKEVSKKKKKKTRSKKKKELLERTDPPSISVIDLFPSGDFPEGEIHQYKDE
ncbi:methionine aminopeptidase 2B-like isoform X2 [Vigna angularis]|nr:methionine aminopeptidase 2B-like isoform X2 [Vigna angularis]XP_052724407.1 methionine aminopeptidase 2B-like isoform X2 [Vigna angularis]